MLISDVLSSIPDDAAFDLFMKKDVYDGKGLKRLTHAYEWACLYQESITPEQFVQIFHDSVEGFGFDPVSIVQILTREAEIVPPPLMAKFLLEPEHCGISCTYKQALEALATGLRVARTATVVVDSLIAEDGGNLDRESVARILPSYQADPIQVALPLLSHFRGTDAMILASILVREMKLSPDQAWASVREAYSLNYGGQDIVKTSAWNGPVLPRHIVRRVELFSTAPTVNDWAHYPEETTLSDICLKHLCHEEAIPVLLQEVGVLLADADPHERIVKLRWLTSEKLAFMSEYSSVIARELFSCPNLMLDIGEVASCLMVLPGMTEAKMRHVLTDPEGVALTPFEANNLVFIHEGPDVDQNPPPSPALGL
jgi:hypothetical protein